jgi:hypothetical protein
MKLTSMGLQARSRGAGVAIAYGVSWLLAATSATWAQTQEVSTPYKSMAPAEQYLMDRDDEIALARSAAPEAISRDAAVLVLGRHGYRTAIDGKNGFVCLVERGWNAAFDWPEYWNSQIRGADCLNPPAARYLVPLLTLRSELVMAGRSRAEIIAAMKAAVKAGKVPALEPGAMSYMMAKSSYLTDTGEHNGPHLMFFMPLSEAATWGADLPGSPVISGPYWFSSPHSSAETADFPAVRVFLVGVGWWSDGTAASAHSLLHELP